MPRIPASPPENTPNLRRARRSLELSAEKRRFYIDVAGHLRPPIA
jgi:hypothetical protein